VTAQVLCSRLTGAAVGIVALAAGALAGEPRDWLVRMNEAVDGLNYTGTFVQLTGTDSRALQVVHRARGGERGERLLTLDGNIQEIIRGPTETRCIIPARKVVIVDRVRDRSLWSSLPDYRGGIDSLYRIADLGREHVSGRKAQRIQVAPADDYRFGTFATSRSSPTSTTASRPSPIASSSIAAPDRARDVGAGARLHGPGARARHHHQGAERDPGLSGQGRRGLRAELHRHAGACGLLLRGLALAGGLRGRAAGGGCGPGVEAQSVANCYTAIDLGLEVLPVLNKIDLPSAEPERVIREIEEIIGLEAEDALRVSAKTGEGIPDLLEMLVARVPPPEGDPMRRCRR
jgi:hypothetical protein